MTVGAGTPAAAAGGVRRRWRGPALVGAFAGFLSGLFGVGGGVLIVPLLVLWLGMRQRLAHGTSLTAIIPIASAGVLGYALHGEIDPVAALLVAGGSVLGSFVGTRLLHRLPQRALQLLFAAFLVATAARLLLHISAEPRDLDVTLWVALGYVGTGVVIGVLSGLLGVGGGIFLVPILVMLFGVDDTVAKGTSLLVVIPTAVAATVQNLRRRNTDLHVAWVTGLAGVVSAFLAAQLAIVLPTQWSLGLFALLLVVTAAQLVLKGRRRSAVDAGEPG